MVYAIIAGGVFLSDLILKRYMDNPAPEPRMAYLAGIFFVLEKYYNEGAALNFMVKKPKLLRIIHTVILVVVGIFSYFLMRLSGHALEKTGVALLLGGGLNNLYDRYTKGHVVDYFHLNFGPKWLRAIVFNISDFCIFIGALLAVAGSEVS